jgi:hypothetical protein
LENLLVRDPDDFTRKKIKEVTRLIIYPPPMTRATHSSMIKMKKSAILYERNALIFPLRGIIDRSITCGIAAIQPAYRA